MAADKEETGAPTDLKEKIITEFYTDEVIQILMERYPHADPRIVREVWKGFLTVVADIASVQNPQSPRARLEVGLRKLFDSGIAETSYEATEQEAEPND